MATYRRVLGDAGAQISRDLEPRFRIELARSLIALDLQGEALMQLGHVDETTLTRMLAKQQAMPFVDAFRKFSGIKNFNGNIKKFLVVKFLRGHERCNLVIHLFTRHGCAAAKQ